MKIGWTMISLAAMSLAAPHPALASGGLRTLSLEQALGQAAFVLVVEKSKPGTRSVDIPIPYTQKGKDGARKKVAQLKATYLLFKAVKRLKLSSAARGIAWTGASLISPGKKVTVKADSVGKPGQKLQVINAHEPINHNVRVRQMQDGTRKIPLYPVLADAVSQEELAKDRRFILLARYNLRYEAFEGLGGFGLVSIKKLKQVKKLLKKHK